MKGTLRVIVILVVALAVAGAANVVWGLKTRHSARPLWRTGIVKRGNLTATITGTGTVEPEEVVDVGAQVSGRFLEFGKDKNGKQIDYGSVVESNMLLARIDPSMFKAAVDVDTDQLDGIAEPLAIRERTRLNRGQQKFIVPHTKSQFATKVKTVMGKQYNK